MGKTGLKLSALSYGAWVTFGNQIDEDVADACMSAAYEAGVNFFDNAEAYANGEAERVMGRILSKHDWPRDTYVVSSKVFFGGERRGPNQRGLSRKHVIEACHAALERLQVDYLDLYFCHRADPETPIEETVRAMNTLIEQGKVLYWGTSEWSAREIQEAIGIAEANHLIPPVVEQPQYNMFARENVEHHLAPLYESRCGLGTTIWSPLASGFLTGKYLDGIPEGSRLARTDLGWLRDRFFGADGETTMRKTRAIAKIAEALGLPMNRLAIAWCLKNPRVSTVIMGASRVEQIHDNLLALEVVEQLDDSVMEQINAILDDESKS